MPLALVTGGSRRIGNEIVRQLHDAGFDILLHYRHSAAPAQTLAAQLNARRADSCLPLQADLADLASIRQLAAAVTARFTALDLLVNNASGFEATPIRGCSEADFDAMLASNLKGPYFLIQALLPLLEQASGSIVNIIDTHAERPLRDFNAYCAAKAGLASLTRSLALELGPVIRVNGVAPGAVLWPEDQRAYDAGARARTLAATPLQRVGEPADIARTVRFLASDAPFITGQVIAVDGGRGLAD